MKTNYVAIDTKDSIPFSLNEDPFTKDTAYFYFWEAYHSDRVEVYLNGKEIYNEIIESYGVPCAGWIKFKKEKENLIQLVINGRKATQFKYENKYKNLTIYWDACKSEFDLEYGYSEPLFD